MKRLLICIAACSLLAGCGNNPKNTDNIPATKSNVAKIEYQVVRSLPHDVTSFTEGFLYHDNQLFESTGSPVEPSYTRSVFGPVDTVTGKINVKGELDRKIYFGEGIVFLKNKLYELTYKNQTAFVYDAKTYKKIGQFSYQNKEGWGLTTDGKYIIMSDVTDKLTYLDPETFKLVKKLEITEDNTAFENVNELEFIKGYIYANVWMKNDIVKIDTATGNIVGKMDLTYLNEEAKSLNPEVDVMNGIAWDSVNDKIYVTGKLWSKIYEIKFTH